MAKVVLVDNKLFLITISSLKPFCLCLNGHFGTFFEKCEFLKVVNNNTGYLKYTGRTSKIFLHYYQDSFNEQYIEIIPVKLERTEQKKYQPDKTVR